MTQPHYDDRQFKAAMARIRDRILADVLTELRAEHEQLSWACAAHSERPNLLLRHAPQ